MLEEAALVVVGVRMIALQSVTKTVFLVTSASAT